MLTHRQGFTLIELLVVIAIIAILAAVLFPVFARARESARQTKCLGNMSQLARAFIMYANDYGQRLPSAARFDAWTYADWVWTHPDGWWQKSPDEAKKCITNGTLFPYVKESKAYICPSDKYAERKFLSYSMNGYLVTWGPGTEIGLSLNLIPVPPQIVLLVNESESLNDGFFAFDPDIPEAIHNGGCNLAFCDGHVKWFEQKQVIAHGDWFDPGYPP